MVSRWQKDKKRKAEARGEGAGAGKKTDAEQGSAAAASAETPAKRAASGTGGTADLKQRVEDLERENKELKEKNKAAADDVVAAMRSHGGSAAVQEMGCTALSNLATGIAQGRGQRMT